MHDGLTVRELNDGRREQADGMRSVLRRGGLAPSAAAHLVRELYRVERAMEGLPDGPELWYECTVDDR